jgi:hypothetical protein
MRELAGLYSATKALVPAELTASPVEPPMYIPPSKVAILSANLSEGGSCKLHTDLPEESKLNRKETPFAVCIIR